MSDDAPTQGWYTDPNDPAQLRWWDGATWTDHVHAQETPAAPAAAAQAAPATEAAPAAQTQPASAPAQPAVTQAQTQAQPAAARGIVSNPAPSASSQPGGGGERSAVSEWFSVRSNQVLFAVLLLAVVLFILVMAGVIS